MLSNVSVSSPVARSIHFAVTSFLVVHFLFIFYEFFLSESSNLACSEDSSIDFVLKPLRLTRIFRNEPVFPELLIRVFHLHVHQTNEIYWRHIIVLPLSGLSVVCPYQKKGGVTVKGTKTPGIRGYEHLFLGQRHEYGAFRAYKRRPYQYVITTQGLRPLPPKKSNEPL